MSSKLSELKELIIKNPELPIKFFTNEDCYSGNFQYEECFISSVSIDEITLHGEKWLSEEDLYEKLECDLYEDGTPENELKDKVEKIVDNTKFKKTICVFFS